MDDNRTTELYEKLTAEQVREAIEEAKDELLESCEYVGDMYQRRSDVLKAFGKMEQAIANELNSNLGNRTCEVEDWYLNDFTSEHEYWYEFEMQCGYRFTWDWKEPPYYCPHCGRQVKR